MSNLKFKVDQRVVSNNANKWVDNGIMGTITEVDETCPNNMVYRVQFVTRKNPLWVEEPGLILVPNTVSDGTGTSEECQEDQPKFDETLTVKFWKDQAVALKLELKGKDMNAEQPTWDGKAIKPNSGKLDGGGQRFNENKLRMELVPPSMITSMAKVMSYGAIKYAPNNWRRGMKWSVPLGCLYRHLIAWQNGEDLDVESGLHHLEHALANIAMLVEFTESYPAGDDRFIPEKLKDENE